VPDTRSHRGPDPHDGQAFGPAALAALRQAVSELSWLLSRGYAMVSAVKLVGDRWSLPARHRLAVQRASCSDSSRSDRLARRCDLPELTSRSLVIDGFNVVTTIETALGGGVVLGCRDQTYRDLAGIHGTYRKVAETLPALRLIGKRLSPLPMGNVHWLFDRPVSNSGRIRAMVLETARTEDWSWTVELVNDPDPLLRESTEIVATADSAVLDRCGRWFNLARAVIDADAPAARIIDLAVPVGG
jgi:hypothetical protein